MYTSIVEHACNWEGFGELIFCLLALLIVKALTYSIKLTYGSGGIGMTNRPSEIAGRLGISATTLRKYEELGLTPPVARTQAGYRLYTDEHIAYFVCVREMLPGFSLTEIAAMLREVMDKRIASALWLANEAQADLRREREIAGKIVRTLAKRNRVAGAGGGLPKLTVNALCRETGVPATTIRYWDKIGLLSAHRSEGNNYRLFTDNDVRQILALCALQLSVYAKRRKPAVEWLRAELQSFDFDDLDRIALMTQQIERHLDRANRAQIAGISALYRLCVQVESGRFG